MIFPIVIAFCMMTAISVFILVQNRAMNFIFHKFNELMTKHDRFIEEIEKERKNDQT